MMKRVRDNYGFTVGELLIAVAIVAVLVAIALPLFTSSLASAKESVDAASCRSARASATTVCLIDHNGNFDKKSPEEWVQIALDDGIPKRSQVDSSQTLNCKIEDSGTRITFFYGKGSGSGGTTPDAPGGDPDPVPDPDPPSGEEGGSSVTVERDGEKHIITANPWGEVVGTVAQGSVYSDEKGVYVFANQTYVESGSKPPLSQMWDCVRLSDSPTLFTNSDIVDQKWVTTPKMGDIFLSNGSYYVFTQNVGPWDVYPGNRIPIDSKFVKTT